MPPVVVVWLKCSGLAVLCQALVSVVRAFPVSVFLACPISITMPSRQSQEIFWPYFSPHERVILDHHRPDVNSKINFSFSCARPSFGYTGDTQQRKGDTMREIIVAGKIIKRNGKIVSSTVRTQGAQYAVIPWGIMPMFR